MKKAVRLFAIFLAAILILGSISVLLASCSASAPSSDKAAYDDYYDYDGTNETQASSPQEGGANNMANSSDASDSDSVNRKIIRNASLDLTAVDVAETYEKILAYAQSIGGYETQREQSDQQNYTVINATIKVPPEQLDNLLSFIKQTGDLINSRITSEDITESYYDAQIRLESMEQTLDKYYQFLSESRNIEETLSVQSQINNLTLEIESLKGKLKLWDALLTESTVELYIRQTNDPVQIRKEVDWKALSFDDMSYLIVSGLKSVVNVLAGIVQWLIIIVVAGAPLWIPILIIVLIILRRQKKKRKAQIKANMPMNMNQTANTSVNSSSPDNMAGSSDHSDKR